MKSTDNEEIIEFNYCNAKKTKFLQSEGINIPGCPACGNNKIIHNLNLGRNTYGCGYSANGSVHGSPLVVVSKCQGTDS